MKKIAALITALALAGAAQAQGFNTDNLRQRLGTVGEVKKVDEITTKNVTTRIEGKIKGTITVTSTKEIITATWEGKTLNINGYPDPKKLYKGVTFKPDYIWQITGGEGTKDVPYQVKFVPAEKK